MSSLLSMRKIPPIVGGRKRAKPRKKNLTRIYHWGVPIIWHSSIFLKSWRNSYEFAVHFEDTISIITFLTEWCDVEFFTTKNVLDVSTHKVVFGIAIRCTATFGFCASLIFPVFQPWVFPGRGLLPSTCSISISDICHKKHFNNYYFSYGLKASPGPFEGWGHYQSTPYLPESFWLYLGRSPPWEFL